MRRIASAKSKTQCMLYRIRKNDLVSLLHDFPEIEAKMRITAQSRRKRLAHYLNPKEAKLSTEDEIDTEDSRTDLFGVPPEEVVLEKNEECKQERIESGLKRRTVLYSHTRRRNALPIS